MKIKKILLPISATMVLISGIEIVNVFLINGFSLSQYGAGFLLGNIMLFIGSSLFTCRLIQAIQNNH